ncbi:MAG: hypothetical protein IPL46_01575 [Saprospiraceae bacterium]|nr:hypothetical protein [Saprospiraceae bacterium]
MQSQPSLPSDTVFCETLLPTEEQLDTLIKRHQEFQDQYDPGGPVPLLAGLRIVPVQLHIVTRSDGTGGIPEADVLMAISDLNLIYAAAGLVFVVCDATNIIQNTALYEIEGRDEGDNMSDFYNVDNVINIFFVDSIFNDDMDPLCGWAYYSSSIFNDYVLMANDCVYGGSTLPHESGHYCDLFHTHECIGGKEFVDGTNCMVAGDLMCSTPADPNLSGKVDAACMYTGMDLDPNMQMYDPSTSNYMSYSRHACRNNFTAEQLAKIAFTAANARDYVNVLTCPGRTEYLDDNCEFVLPDYRNLMTLQTGCLFDDTIQNPAPGTLITMDGQTQVTITVIDANMDMSSCTFIVYHLDTMAPVISMISDDTIVTNLDCMGILGDYRDSVMVMDNCDPNPIILQDPPPGTDIGGVGASQIVCISAEDQQGNFREICINVTVADAQPAPVLNCHDLNLSLDADGLISFQVRELVPGSNCSNFLDLKVETQSGILVHQDFDLLMNSVIAFGACDYRNQRLKATVTDQSGACWGYLTFKQSNGPEFTRGRSFTVFCNDSLVTGGHILNIAPIAAIPCFGLASVNFVADWIQAYDCDSDTAKVILREYEAFDKLGRRGTVLDTIVVVKLPQIVNFTTGANYRNIGCKDRDTLYCGINELTDSLTGYTPVGPYLLIEEFPPLPSLDLDLDGVNCDTIWFCAFKDGELVSLFDDGNKCGLQVHKEIKKFGDPCNLQYKIIIEIKQNCSKDPVILDCFVPGNHQNIETIAEGYYRCEFWLMDRDTTPPKFAPKIFNEFNCITIDTSFFGGDLAFLDIFQPVVYTSDHDCAAYSYLPPLCVFDDWSGIKLAKATVEGGGTYILENNGEKCFLLDFDDDQTISLEDYVTLFGADLDQILNDSIIALLDSLGILNQGNCYRSQERIKLLKSDKPVRIFYEVYDSCHLIGRDTAYIHVKDGTPPVAIADKGVTVSLSDKKIWVDAGTFDEGSWDNCGLNMVLARRADWKEACVDFCYNKSGENCNQDSLESALCWLWTDGHDTLWTLDLEDDKHCDEVEAHYKNSWIGFARMTHLVVVLCTMVGSMT